MPCPRLCSGMLFTLLLAGCGGGDASQSQLPDQFSAVRRVDGAPACPAAPNPLRNITSVQGSGRLSPRNGQAVTIRGVVTGDFQDTRQLHGFFLQQPAPDRNAGTSEGVFVYLPSGAKRVATGQYVQVSGSIDEYKSSSADTDRLTRINNVRTITVCGDGPAITPHELTLPVASNKDFEALEGMLVRFTQPLVVSDNHDLGDHGALLLSAGDRLWQPRNHPVRTDTAAIAAGNVLSQILLDDGANTVHPAPIPYLSASDDSGTRRAGDTVTGLEGILSWSYNAWRVHPTGRPVFTASNPRPAVPEPVGGTLRAASLNVLNYFTTLRERGANTSLERTRQRDKLVSAIAGLDADVLGLMEIETGTAALDQLVKAINARVGPDTYAAIRSGTPGTDAIKVAIIYKPGSVTPVDEPALPPTRGFIVDGGVRPPLAQRFSVRNPRQEDPHQREFWLVVNHLKSKAGCPQEKRSIERDLGQGCWNAARVRQAASLTDWVGGLVSRSGEADVLMLGDFNAYLDEDPIRVIESAGYDNLLRRLPGRERYSYVFAGQSGALDHGFASKSLASQVSGVTIWHINADEPAVLDYNTEQKPDDRYATTPYRSSDHDPVLIGLDLLPRP